jgi:general secretion pathway protein M
MSADASAGNAALSALMPLRQWWRGLALRERRLLLLAVTVLLSFVLWVFAVQPAWRTLSTAPAQLDALDAQLQTMQRAASEANELRAAPPVNATQAAAALKLATDRLGDKGKLALQGDRAVLTLTEVGTVALSDWLAEARSGARARPVEATLNRGAQGFSGSLILSLPSAGAAP